MATKNKIIVVDKARCPSCGRYIAYTKDNFYASFSPLHQGAQNESGVTLVPYCKQCVLKDMDINNMLVVKNALLMCDKPFKNDVWLSTLNKHSEKNSSSIFGFYMKNLQLNFKYERYVDSDFEDVEYIENNKSNNKVEIDESIKFKWGNNWSTYDYQRLENFYKTMKQSNKIETPQDEDYLKKLAVLSVKIDNALLEDNDSKAQKLGNLYSKYMSDSKFRAADMSGVDINGGARTISQITEEVESDDFIPPWEKFEHKLKVPQDIVDKTIMYMLNFVLKFKDKQVMSEPPIDTPEVGE